MMESQVSVSTLSSLHTHCNNKIAWFKGSVVAEHREWLSTVIADARSILLTTSKDEPISVLPPRTPHAARKRRCVEKPRSSGVAQCVPIYSPAGVELPMSPASTMTTSLTPPCGERHTAAVLCPGKRTRAAPAASAATTPQQESEAKKETVAVVKFASPPQETAESATSVKDAVGKRATATRGRALRSQRTSPRQASPCKEREAPAPVAATPPAKNSKQPSVLVRTLSAVSSAVAQRVGTVSPVLNICPPQSNGDAVSSVEDEQDGASHSEPMTVDSNSGDAAASPVQLQSALSQESLQVLERETGSQDVRQQSLPRADKDDNRENNDEDSFVTAPDDYKTADDAASCASPGSFSVMTAGSIATARSPPTSSLESMPPPQSSDMPLKDGSTPKNSKKPVSPSRSTPVVSLSPLGKNQAVLRSNSSTSNLSRITRSSTKSHSESVAADLAAPRMPACYGLQAFHKTPGRESPPKRPSPEPPQRLVKETPVRKDAKDAASSSYIPPSATRILRSALRKHGAEADSDLHMKFGPGVDVSSAMMRLGAPLRALPIQSPVNSDTEADDDHPKVLKRLNNIVSSVTSLIPHTKTPKKMDSKAKQDKLKAELDAKQKQTEERKRRKEEQRLHELEEKKQKRAERERLNRKRKADMEEERNAKLLKKTVSEAPSCASIASTTSVSSTYSTNQKKKEQEETRRKEQRQPATDARRRQDDDMKAKKRIEAAAPVSKKPIATSTVSANGASSNGLPLRSTAQSPRLGLKSRMATALSQAPILTSNSNSSLALSKNNMPSPLTVSSSSTHGRSAAVAGSACESSASSGLAGLTRLGAALPASLTSSTATLASSSSGGSGSAGGSLKKTLSRTANAPVLSSSSSSKIAEKKFVPTSVPSSLDSSSSVPTSSSTAVRPATPSCSNLVRTFPSTASNKSSSATTAKTAATPFSTATTSSATSYASSKAQPTASLKAIPETAAKGAGAFASSSGAARSPLKTLNKTYTMPATSSNGSIAPAKKVTISPMPKSRTVPRSGSQMDASYGSRNIVPTTPNASYNNYNIDDMDSDDPTDDEESPKHKIPKWAQQGPLKRALIDQEISGDIADQLFPVTDLETPNLTRIFQRERQRYLKRTSSAIWNSPLVKRP